MSHVHFEGGLSSARKVVENIIDHGRRNASVFGVVAHLQTPVIPFHVTGRGDTRVSGTRHLSFGSILIRFSGWDRIFVTPFTTSKGSGKKNHQRNRCITQAALL